MKLVSKAFPISDDDFRGTLDFSGNSISKKLFYLAKTIRIGNFEYKIYYRNYKLKKFYLKK